MNITEQELRHIFASNLKRLLNINGMRQADLCRKLDLKSNTVSNWLNYVIQQLADYFNVPIGYMLSEHAADNKSITEFSDFVNMLDDVISTVIENQVDAKSNESEYLYGFISAIFDACATMNIEDATQT